MLAARAGRVKPEGARFSGTGGGGPAPPGTGRISPSGSLPIGLTGPGRRATLLMTRTPPSQGQTYPSCFSSSLNGRSLMLRKVLARRSGVAATELAVLLPFLAFLFV